MPIFSGSSENVPVGTIALYGANTAPGSSWLICDGAAVSRSTYSVLFGIISTSYGTGDGSTTFNLPDLRGRLPVGKGTHVDVDTLGDNDGAALADRRPKHKHTVNDPGHSHTQAATGGTFGSSGASGATSSPNPTSTNTTGVTVGPQTTSPTDAPAYVTVQYLIRALV